MKTFAIVDIETTGMRAGRNSITEIAIVLHDGKKIIDSYETLINPESLISPYVVRLTGITNEMLVDAPKFHEVAKKIWTMTEGAIFVAHNVSFDYSFLREEFKSLGADFRRQKLCTVRLSRKIFPGLPSYSLGNLCNTLGIEIKNRHRAMGDVEATVELFQQCLRCDRDDFIPNSLKHNSRESLLPPNLPMDVFLNLPEKTGVYYFHNDRKDIIYVGKAINIKKRILSHFSGKGPAKLSFINSIADITYTICGTELIALLFESSEIKRIFPIYNQAQKFERNNYILTDYFDQKGIHHLVFARKNKRLHAITNFRSFDMAREFVFDLIATYNLCPRFCGIQTGTGACLDHDFGKCKGVCAGEESIESYNKRVQKAINRINKKLQTNLIIGEGRTANEKSVVLVEQGIYKGFGYFPDEMKMDSPLDANEIIHPYKHTTDVQRILERHT